jgi:hypothetical protein
LVESIFDFGRRSSKEEEVDLEFSGWMSVDEFILLGD